MTRVAVVDYDLGNLPSVTKAFERAGASVDIVVDADALDERFDAIVLPGVGHFGAGARNLARRGFEGALREWAAAGRPLLGICVGFQLFFERSDEDPEARGLGILPGRVERLRAPKVPHMGWNAVHPSAGARILGALAPGDMAYFVHSYVVRPEGGEAATTTYGETFCSAVEVGRVTGVQFHPEKSAEVGRRLIERFVGEVSG